MRPTPKCVLDRSRPCNACIAPDPSSCPYPYLLAGDDSMDLDDDIEADGDSAHGRNEAPAGRAVDLSAGGGRNGVYLAERGWEVDAVDFSLQAGQLLGDEAVELGLPDQFAAAVALVPARRVHVLRTTRP